VGSIAASEADDHPGVPPRVVQARRGRSGEWAPLLIGPGDLPLSAAQVREAVIGSGLIADEKVAANYRQLAAADIVSDDGKGGSARLLDLARSGAPFAAANPRAAERMATALFLLSIVGARSQGRQGATEAEVKAAAFVPDVSFDVSQADVVLAELQDPDRGLAALERLEGRGGQPAAVLSLDPPDLEHAVPCRPRERHGRGARRRVVRVVERLTTTGPFRSKLVVDAGSEETDTRPLRAILETAGIDDAAAAPPRGAGPPGASAFSTGLTTRAAPLSAPHLASATSASPSMGLLGRLRGREHAAAPERPNGRG